MTDQPDRGDTSLEDGISRRDFGRLLGAVALGAAPGANLTDQLGASPGPVDVPDAPADLCFTSAIQLAAMIRTRKVSAR